MAKRGEPLPINQALNRPRAKLGLDLSARMAIVFVCVTVWGTMWDRRFQFSIFPC
jgi:hypothetical protein